VTFSGTANDAEDGNLSSQIVWSSNIDGNIGNGTSFEKVLSSGTHSITAKVTDSKDLSATSQLNITIESEPDPENSIPSVTIQNPSSGSTFTTDETINFSGNASDQEDGNLSDQIQWNSNLIGLLGYGSSVSIQLSAGSHTITAKASDEKNATGTATISLNIVEEEEEEPSTPPEPPSSPPAQNSPPTVTIDQPLNGATFKEGDIVVLEGSAADPENGNLSNFILWNSSLDGFLGTGSTLSVILAVGEHTITTTVSDAEDVSSSSSISISVEDEEEDDTDTSAPTPSPPAQNTPPSLTINQPTNNSTFYEGESIVISGSADDNEDGNLSHRINWSSNIDGYLNTGSTVNVSLSNGEHIVTAKVTDFDNSSSTKTISVNVIDPETETPESPEPVNYPPAVVINEPISTLDFSVNQSIVFNGSAQDPEDGDLSYNIQWSSNIDGYLGSGNTISSALSDGNHIIEASVTDSGNLNGSATIFVTVSTEEPDEGSNDNDGDLIDNARKNTDIYVAKFEKMIKQYGNIKGEKTDLISVIEVRYDSNHNGLRDSKDKPLANATVTILISSFDGGSWTLSGTTGKDGTTEITLGRVPLENYNTSILEVSHSGYKSYDPAFGNETVSANYYLK
jgi:hypothetical protein